MSTPTLKELVIGDQVAEFQSCDGHYLRYKVGSVEFPIPLEDTKGGYFGRTMKASILMGWIRRHLDNLKEAAKHAVVKGAG